LEETVRCFGDSGRLDKPFHSDNIFFRHYFPVGFHNEFTHNRIAYQLDGTAWWWLRSPEGNRLTVRPGAQADSYIK